MQPVQPLQSLCGRRRGFEEMRGATATGGLGQKPLQSLQSLRAEEGLQPVQSLRSQEKGLQSLQPVRRKESLQPVQSLRRQKGLQPVQSLQSL